MYSKNLKDENLSRFQWKVLKQTARIPFGQTRTYQWVAEKIGQPTAARAVGQALRRNPYPVVIPCHRVIKSDGNLGGYVGRYDRRKEKLLALEQLMLEVHRRKNNNL